MAQDDDSKKMLETCLKIKNDLYQVITFMEIKQINNLGIHKGKDPSVEIKCFDNKHKIKIMFPGDMERQRFVEQLIRIKRGDKDADEDSEPEVEDEEDNDVDHEAEESDELPQKAVCYD